MTVTAKLTEDAREAMRRALAEYEDVSIVFKIEKARSRFTMRGLLRWLKSKQDVTMDAANPWDVTVDVGIELTGTKPGHPFPTTLAYQWADIPLSPGDSIKVDAPWRIQIF